MSESDKNEKIANFTAVTGVDTDRAKFYLEASAWKLDVAIGAFYEEGEAMEEEPIVLEPEPALPTASARGAHADPRTDPPQSGSSKKPTQQSRFGSIHQEVDSSDDERESFYAGGSEHGAGQQVLGAKKKKPEELVQDMFKSAKDHGAEEIGPGSEDRPQAKLKSFRGTGYKLGETEESSQVIHGAPMEASNRQVDMVLKLWKNGFSIDNGELRDYHDPENEHFLSAIKKGEVPTELLRMAKGGEVNLNMEDHRENEYEKPKVVLKAFTGSGNRLGSTVPEMTAPAPTADQAQAAKATADASVKIDQSQPTTSVQIRLADGSRLVAKFNHSHKVSDIRSYITTSRPQYVTANFVLMTTFPNKEITDETQTIEQAKLQNAVIVQRLK